VGRAIAGENEIMTDARLAAALSDLMSAARVAHERTEGTV